MATVKTVQDKTIWIGIEIEGYNEQTITQTFKAAEAAGEYLDLFASKQNDYGVNNIGFFGEQGVVIRLHDKIQRLIRMVWKQVQPKNESIRDTWLDVIGYGIIGLLTHDKKWDATGRT